MWKRFRNLLVNNIAKSFNLRNRLHKIFASDCTVFKRKTRRRCLPRLNLRGAPVPGNFLLSICVNRLSGKRFGFVGLEDLEADQLVGALAIEEQVNRLGPQLAR